MRIKLILAVLGGLLGNLMGGWDTMLKTLVAMVIVDYLTGVMAAVYKRKLSSAIGYKGIIKKIGIFVIIFVASRLDSCFSSELIRNITIAFYISNEGISILENVGKTGVKYPVKLKAILAQLKDDTKGAEKK